MMSILIATRRLHVIIRKQDTMTGTVNKAMYITEILMSVTENKMKKKKIPSLEALKSRNKMNSKR